MILILKWAAIILGITFMVSVMAMIITVLMIPPEEEEEDET